MKIEKKLLEDLFVLFDQTLNVNAKKALQRIITTKLSSKDAIIERQQIVKCFIKNQHIFKDYHYPFIHHREVFTNLEQMNFTQILSYENPLKAINQNKKSAQNLKGKVIQLVHFFHFYYTNYLTDFDATDFPESYKISFNVLKDYFTSVNPESNILKIKQKKFGNKQVVEIIKIIHQQFIEKKQLQFIEYFAEFEAYISIARKTSEHSFIFPELNDTTITLTDFYHPILKKPVKNSFVNSNGVILLTGANMAGKSTFLKSLGICVYLTHTGLPVPAKYASIPFYDDLYIFINNNDDLNNGYSYFMQEILNLKEVVISCNAGNRCFALFDELFKGTNFEDAFDILTTTLHGLLKYKHSFFTVSSHIHQLKEIVENEESIKTYYLECLINDNLPVFTYQIKEGFSDLKLGKIIFENQHLYGLLN